MHELTDIREDETPARRWTEHVTWGAMLPIGWLIYELTARPSFAIVVACGKFGWHDFLTAHWLLRTDPDRGRGRTCFWFYVASGLWKITVAAFVTTGLILFVWVAMNGKAPHGLIDASLTAVIGIVLLAVVPLIGVINARIYRVKVWVDSSIHPCRRHNVWPPQATGFNSAMGLLFPALLVPVVVTALATFHFGIWWLLASVLTEGIYIWTLFRGVAAEHPDECWGTAADFDGEFDEIAGADEEPPEFAGR